MLSETGVGRSGVAEPNEDEAVGVDMFSMREKWGKRQEDQKSRLTLIIPAGVGRGAEERGRNSPE